MKKIMVFDEPEIVSFIQRVVGDRCEVVWVYKDEEVLPCLQKENPDFLLMNYEVSGCNRFGKLLKEIRFWDSIIPIILMSENDLLDHHPLNVNGSIMKPFEKEFLEATLRRSKI